MSLEKTVADRVSELVSKYFGVSEGSPVEPETPFRDLGDSLEAVEAVILVEDEFDIVIFDHETAQCETVGDLAKLVEVKLREKADEDRS